MKLYHVSEEKDIGLFIPRKPIREDMKHSPPLVWAVNERGLPNFLTPRDCPRVTCHKNENTSEKDITAIFSSESVEHLIAVEHAWYEEMKEVRLYIYEFDSEDFYLQDEVAGYYVSEKQQVPIDVRTVEDVFHELAKRNVEVRLLPDLSGLREKIVSSSMNWSMCRMRNAGKR